MSVSFKYVIPTDEQKDMMLYFRRKYQELYDEMEKLPANRGASLARTKLEESAMWLNKSITENC